MRTGMVFVLMFCVGFAVIGQCLVGGGEGLLRMLGVALLVFFGAFIPVVGAGVSGAVAVLLALGCAWGLTMPLMRVAVSTGHGPLGIVFWQQLLTLAVCLGLLAALGAVLLVLPGVLAMAGRRAFWPFVPRPGDAQKDGVWGRIAGGVVRRPGAVLAGGIAVLAVLASGILGTRVGLPQADAFRGETESAAGLATLGTHFPAGSAAPAPGADAPSVSSASNTGPV